MKSAKGIITRPNGFTLVEIVITLIAAGILGTIFINLMGTALNDSWNSVEMVRNEASVVRKMEEIIAVYVEGMNNDPDNALKDINDAIIAGTYNEPASAPYTITVTSEYIKFDSGGGEQPGDPLTDNTIKVTVQAGDSRLTTILTQSRRSGDRIVRY
jgi:prepilin-type N-terminal cleavage/methylation domain-containing protein